MKSEKNVAARRQAAERQAAILDALPAHVALVDRRGVILAVNEAWRSFAQANVLPCPSAGVGLNYLQVCEEARVAGSEDAGNAAAGIRRVLCGEAEEFALEYPCHAPDEERWFRLTVTPLHQEPFAGAVVMHVDITERKQAEARVHRLNRLYAVSSGINEAIVRLQDPQRLYEHACRVAVERGGLVLAWVGLADTEGNGLQPVAQWGRDEGYLDLLRLTATTNQSAGEDSGGKAFRTGQAVCCNDIAAEAGPSATTTEALRRGYRSCAAFPLRPAGRMMGILVVYGDRPGFFGSEEIRLLTTLADNISFAIESHARDQQRQRMEDSLRASEASLAAAQRIARFGSWELDLTGQKDIDANALRWSDEMYRIAGLEPGAVPVSNALFFQHVPSEDHAIVQNAVATAVRERRPYAIVHRFIRPDGQVRVWHESAQLAVEEGTGRPLKLIGTAHDITEQRQAEETLRRSEREQRHLAEELEIERARLVAAQRVAKVGSWETIVATLEVSWSEETHRIFETDPATFRPTHPAFLARVHPDDRTAVDRAFVESLSRQEPQAIEHRLQMPDGRVKFVEERWQVFHEVAGQPVRALGTCRDITERRGAEDKLREQAELLDHAHDAILVLDHEHRVTYWNRSAGRLYGWSVAEACGRFLQELLRMDAAQFEAADRAVQQTGAWHGEIQKTARSGHVLTVDGSWTLLRDARGKPKSILIIDTDITERKKLEQQFLRSQRMESLGTLAGGIAHDINNLLAPITMGVELLRLHEPHPKSQLVIDNIERSARRGANLVRQVLSFARGVEGSRVPLQVRHLVREIESIVENTFPKNIVFESQLGPNLWPVVGDPTQISQVLLNLCVNARDAMPEGGHLTLRAVNAEVDLQYALMNRGVAAGRYVTIEVTDDGCGIPREIVDRIFEPFFTTKKLGQGTGLGLSTVLGIVRSHGGFVNVYSEPDHGSTFHVGLPAQPDSPTAASSSPFEEPLPRGDGETILLVDDEASILSTTRQTLEAFGYRVLTAVDGAQAISCYAMHRGEIALVLTDMMMPVMDGPALINALRRIDPKVRIIASSGLHGNENRAASTGVKHFLVKPFTADTMLKALRTALVEKIDNASS